MMSSAMPCPPWCSAGDGPDAHQHAISVGAADGTPVTVSVSANLRTVIIDPSPLGLTFTLDGATAFAAAVNAAAGWARHTAGT